MSILKSYLKYKMHYFIFKRKILFMFKVINLFYCYIKMLF